MNPEQLSDGITIINGDCLDAIPSLLLYAHAMITDPPFDEEAHTMQRRAVRSVGIVSEPLGFNPISMKTRNNICLLASSHVSGWMLAFCQAESVGLWRDAMVENGVDYKRSMVWIKPDGMPQYSGDKPGMGYESIVCGWCGKGKSSWNGGGQHGVFMYNKNSGGRHLHQTQKPLNLMLRLVELFSNQGETVIDPFMGSGTTCIACIRTGRRFIGVEMNKQYYDVAKERILKELQQLRLSLA